MSFCILIPTVNRKDLLVPALKFYRFHMPNTPVFVWDNGNQGIPNLTNVETAVVFKNYGVAASWNRLINLATSRGFENYLILNDDIMFTTEEHVVQRLIDTDNKRTFFRCQQDYHWSSFLLRKSVYDAVGPFDENFERCYFEDNDYEYRLKLEGIDVIFEKDLNPGHYKNSASIEREPLLNNFVKNREYFVNKWGGPPNEEKYKTPFNK